ncbi:MAG: C-terminal binding protein [Dehalococcoidia bacterium]|jgi:D-3-phosphoglycerate dehydrogenase|tara:strand:- start:18099 stop:19088 length:990 start_codon:yes stop_codon:yes gene_type:complete
MKYKAVITDYVWPNLDIETKILNENNIEVVDCKDKNDQQLKNELIDADAILFCFREISSDLLEATSKCKVASRYGIGVDNIDIQKCTELGIVVTNIPDYCLEEVSDHAIGMILALNRRINDHSNMVKNGGWYDLDLDIPVQRLSESILGIVGFGRIGRTIANRISALGIKCIAFDPLLNLGEKIDNVEIVSFNNLLEMSDFITVHVPLNEQTHHLFSEKEFKAMKDNAIIVNCARGGLIDEIAASNALSNGQIGGIGLDVIEDTSKSPTSPLFINKNVIITPHTAFFSKASNEELQRRTAEEIVRVIKNKKPENFINPEVIGNTRLDIN